MPRRAKDRVSGHTYMVEPVLRVVLAALMATSRTDARYCAGSACPVAGSGESTSAT